MPGHSAGAEVGAGVGYGRAACFADYAYVVPFESGLQHGGHLFGGGVLVEYFERKCVDVDIAVAMLEEAACRAQFLDNEKPHLAQQFQIAAR